MSRYKLVEKANHLAVHGLFDTKESGEQHLAVVVPKYCARGFFSDKTLKPESFELVPIKDKPC